MFVTSVRLDEQDALGARGITLALQYAPARSAREPGKAHNAPTRQSFEELNTPANSSGASMNAVTSWTALSATRAPSAATSATRRTTPPTAGRRTAKLRKAFFSASIGATMNGNRLPNHAASTCASACPSSSRKWTTPSTRPTARRRSACTWWMLTATWPTTAAPAPISSTWTNGSRQSRLVLRSQPAGRPGDQVVAALSPVIVAPSPDNHRSRQRCRPLLRG